LKKGVLGEVRKNGKKWKMKKTGKRWKNGRKWKLEEFGKSKTSGRWITSERGGERFGDIRPEDTSKAAAVYKQKNRLKIGGKG
jgi:hypothetical protein